MRLASDSACSRDVSSSIKAVGVPLSLNRVIASTGAKAESASRIPSWVTSSGRFPTRIRMLSLLKWIAAKRARQQSAWRRIQCEPTIPGVQAISERESRQMEHDLRNAALFLRGHFESGFLEHAQHRDVARQNFCDQLAQCAC